MILPTNFPTVIVVGWHAQCHVLACDWAYIGNRNARLADMERDLEHAVSAHKRAHQHLVNNPEKEDHQS